MPALCLLLAAATALASCGGSDNDGDTPDRRQTVRVVMNINVGASQPATRTNTNWTDPDPTSPGNGMENYIDASSLRIFLYNSSGEFVASASPITASRVSGSETQYQVVGSFEVSTLGLSSYQLADAKVAVFANSRGGSTLDGYASAKSGLSAVSAINDGYDAATSEALQSIPMYGVKKATLDLTPGNRNELGDIYMLRSLAKIEVELSDSLKGRGYSLTSTTLTGCNTLYNELPAGYAGTDDTQLLTYDDSSAPMSFNPCDDAFSAETSIDFTGKTLYLPEATADGSHAVNISVELTRKADGLTRTATFPFAAYSSAGIQTGTMNIVRNHHYRFVIIDSSLRVQLDVLPWVVFRHSDIVI